MVSIMPFARFDNDSTIFNVVDETIFFVNAAAVTFAILQTFGLTFADHCAIAFNALLDDFNVLVPNYRLSLIGYCVIMRMV